MVKITNDNAIIDFPYISKLVWPKVILENGIEITSNPLLISAVQQFSSPPKYLQLYHINNGRVHMYKSYSWKDQYYNLSCFE